MNSVGKVELLGQQQRYPSECIELGINLQIACFAFVTKAAGT
jgi:hypothetical protein